MPLYSVSKIQTFLNCPLMFRFAYIDGIKKEEENIEAFLGSRVHEALFEVMRLAKDFGREPDYETARSIFEKKWNSALHEKIVINDEFAELEDYRRKGLTYIDNFFQLEIGRDYGSLLALEHTIYFDVGGYKFVGVIDRLHRDGNIFHIIDYKTGQGPMTQEKADEDMQLGLYEIALRQSYEVEAVILHWYMLNQGIVVDSTRTSEKLDELKEEVSRLVRQIEEESEFRPRVSSLCRWCSFTEECLAERERRTICATAGGSEPSLEEIVSRFEDLYEEKSSLEKKVKEVTREMEKLIPAIADECVKRDSWSIEGKEHVLRVEKEIKRNIPAKGDARREELENLLRNAGLWEKVATIDRGELIKGLDRGILGSITERVREILNERESFKIKVEQKENSCKSNKKNGTASCE